jgi:hypothetical protein
VVIGKQRGEIERGKTKRKERNMNSELPAWIFEVDEEEGNDAEIKPLLEELEIDLEQIYK